MKRFALIAGIVIALLLATVAALPFLIDSNHFRPMLESRLSKALGRDVKVGNLQLNLWSGRLAASDLAIGDDAAYSAAPFLHAKSLKLVVAVRPLILSRQLKITQLTIEQPEIALVQSAKGAWNFSSLGGKRAAPSDDVNFSIQLLDIAGGRLSLAQQDGQSPPKLLENVNIEVRNFSGTAAFPFTMSGDYGGGGHIAVNGTAGPIDRADAARTPAKIDVTVSQFNLASAAIQTGGALAGILSLTGSGTSDGAKLHLTGTIRADQLRLARNGTPAQSPVAFDFDVDHDLLQHSGTLRSGTLHLGGALANLMGTYLQQGESAVLDMHLNATGMPVPQLATMLPSVGVVLPAGSSLQGGTVNAHLSFLGPADLLVTSGNLALNNTSLSGFDLGSQVSTIAKLAGVNANPNTAIQTFAANIRLAPEGDSVQNVDLIAPAIGELTGAGVVTPGQILNFKMQATLHTKGGILAIFGREASVPFSIQGTAAHPVFNADVKGLASGLLGGLLSGKKK